MEGEAHEPKYTFDNLTLPDRFVVNIGIFNHHVYNQLIDYTRYIQLTSFRGRNWLTHWD